MGYQMVTGPMTSRDPQRCCEELRSAILATAWLLVSFNAALSSHRLFIWLVVHGAALLLSDAAFTGMIIV